MVQQTLWCIIFNNSLNTTVSIMFLLDSQGPREKTLRRPAAEPERPSPQLPCSVAASQKRPRLLGSMGRGVTSQIWCRPCSVATASYNGGTRCKNAAPSLPTMQTMTPASGTFRPAPRPTPVRRRKVYTVCGRPSSSVPCRGKRSGDRAWLGGLCRSNWRRRGGVESFC